LKNIFISFILSFLILNTISEILAKNEVIFNRGGIVKEEIKFYKLNLEIVSYHVFAFLALRNNYIRVKKLIKFIKHPDDLHKNTNQYEIVDLENIFFKINLLGNECLSNCEKLNSTGFTFYEVKQIIKVVFKTTNKLYTQLLTIISGMHITLESCKFENDEFSKSQITSIEKNGEISPSIIKNENIINQKYKIKNLSKFSLDFKNHVMKRIDVYTVPLINVVGVIYNIRL
jgi:hypothetical protein